MGSDKMSRSLCPPARIFKVYIVYTKVHCLGGLNDTLLTQSYTLENGSHCGGHSGQNNVPRAGRQDARLDLSSVKK